MLLVCGGYTLLPRPALSAQSPSDALSFGPVTSEQRVSNDDGMDESWPGYAYEIIRAAILGSLFAMQAEDPTAQDIQAVLDGAQPAQSSVDE